MVQGKYAGYAMPEDVRLLIRLVDEEKTVNSIPIRETSSHMNWYPCFCWFINFIACTSSVLAYPLVLQSQHRIKLCTIANCSANCADNKYGEYRPEIFFEITENMKGTK